MLLNSFRVQEHFFGRTGRASLQDYKFLDVRERLADSYFPELRRGHAGGLLEARAQVRDGRETGDEGYLAQRHLTVKEQFLYAFDA